MKTVAVGDVEPGDIFLYKKAGEELRAWIHIGFMTNSPNSISCKKEDRNCRQVRGESLYDYTGRSKYINLDIRKHVLA